MKKITKTILLTFLSCLCFTFAMGCSEKKPTSDNSTGEPTSSSPEIPEAEEATDYEDSVFKTTYSLNDELHMNYLLMDIDGVQYRVTEGELEYPDGKTYSKTDYKLSSVGQYTLTYTAKLNETVKTGVKEFNVFNTYYSVDSEYSSVEYGENMPYTVFTTGTYNNGTKDVVAWGGGLNTAHTNGLKVSLAEGDVFKWDKPLKFTNGVNDLFNIVLPHATPYKRFPDLTGVPKQADRIIVTLTDCYDSNKTLEFVFDFSRDLGLLCVRVGANGDTPSSLNSVKRNDQGVDTGYRAENPKTYCFIDGQEYVCIYGTRGTQLNAMSPGGYTLSIDTDTAEVFAASAEMVEKGNTSLVNMLNNPDIHEDPSKYFNGFTNNEAYLSIKCEDYYDSTCEFILTNILSSSQDELKAETYVDGVNPLIEVNAPSDSINVVSGKSFSIFDAECYDVNLKGDYKVSCYYAYGTENQASIKIVDGKLNLPMAGKYALVYTVADTFGNRTQKIITLNAKATGEAIDYTETKLSDIKLGEEVILPKLNPVGLNGDVSVSSSIIDENGNSIEMDADGKFMLVNAGEYQVRYVMRDGVYEKEFSYSINGVTNEDNIQFLDKPALEQYLMSGRTYYFEDYYAYTFENATPTAKETDVYANVDDGGFVKIENYNSYLVEANDTVQFKFVYKNSEIVSNKLKVVDAGLNATNETLNLPGYFIADENATVTKNEEDEFVKISVSRNSTLNFINPISFKAFTIRFNIPTGMGNFGKMSFILTDFYDSTKTVKITYLNGTSPQLLVGDKSTAISSFIGNPLNVEYKNKKIQSESASIAVDNIFTTDKVMLSICFEDVSANTELQLLKLNGQSFNVTEDIIYPDICVQSVSGRYAVGSTVTIFAPCVTDVLSPVNTSKTMVTVQDASGAYYKDSNGNELNKFVISEDIQVLFETIGKVYVNYYTEDAAGNQLNKGRGLRYTLDITDVNAPTITLESGFDKFTVKVAELNDEIKIASYTVSDDFSPVDKLEVTVRIFTPYNEMYVVEGDTFIATRKGSYRVVYSCVDASGNIAEAYYTVNVN